MDNCYLSRMLQHLEESQSHEEDLDLDLKCSLILENVYDAILNNGNKNNNTHLNTPGLQFSDCYANLF